MRKILLLLALMSTFVMHGAIFKIHLTDNFLKYDGKYLVMLDLAGKKLDKVFYLDVENHVADITCIKQAVKKEMAIKGKAMEAAQAEDENADQKETKKKKGKKLKINEVPCKKQDISIKNNVITLQSGVLKGREAKDLEVFVLESNTFPIGTSTKAGLAAQSQNFTIDIGPGIGLMLAAAGKPKGEDVKYTFIGFGMPDGAYTLRLVLKGIMKDRVYKFKVVDGKIDTLLPGSDKTGSIKEKGFLEINADQMCAIRRTLKAFLGIGIAIPVAIGTAAIAFFPYLAPGAFAAVSAAIMSAGGAIGGAVGAGIGAVSGAVVGTATGIGAMTGAVAGAASTAGGIVAAGTALGTSVAGSLISALTVTSVTSGVLSAAGAVVSGAQQGLDVAMKAGVREALAQLTLDSGDYKGDRAIKFEYTICKKNVFLLYKSDLKVNISATKITYF